MKKRIFALLAVVLAMACVLTACKSAEKTYKVSNPNNATAVVRSNGGSVVVQGDYIYFVNGIASYETKAGSNVFGKVIKGALMRYKMTGGVIDVDSIETVVPKKVRDSATEGGIYVYGSKVYYVTLTEKVDKSNEVLDDIIEFYECNVDGSGTRLLMRLEGNDTKYMFGKSAFVYYLDSELHSVNYATLTDTIIAEGVSNVVFPSDSDYDAGATQLKYSDCVYYTTASSDDVNYTYNEMYAVSIDGSYKALIMGRESFIEADTITAYDEDNSKLLDYTKLYNTNILKIQNGVVYYTKSYAEGSTSKACGTYCVDMKNYAFDDTKDVRWIADNEVELSTLIYTSVYAMGNGKILFGYNSATYVRETTGIETKIEDGAWKVIYDDADVVVIDKGDKGVIKVDITGTAGPGVIISNIAADTSWRTYEVVGSKIYYFNKTNSQNYLHCYDIVTDTDSLIGVRIDKDVAADVDVAINNLPGVDSITVDDQADIEGVRAMYDALTDSQKQYVYSYSILQEIEETLTELLAD